RKPDKEMTRSFQQFLWSYLEKPHGEEAEFMLNKAYAILFEIARKDDSYDAGKLEEIVQGLADHRRWQDYAAQGVNELANRGIALERAEGIARVALDKAEKRLAEKERDPQAIYLQYSRELVASLHDALGWVLFKRGQIDAAEKELK